MKSFVWCLLFSTALLSSCESTNDGRDDADSIPSGATSDQAKIPDDGPGETPMVQITCTEPGFGFQFPLEKSKLNGAQPVCAMDPATGLLTVDAGENFQLDIERDDESLAFARSVLAEDLLFKWEISEESDHGFIAQARFPDGAAHYWHVFQVQTISGQPYFIRSREGSNFTRQDIMLMRESIEAMSAIH